MKLTTGCTVIIWVFCITAITAGSLLPYFSTPEKYHIDKLIHGLAYAGLAFLPFFFTKNRKAELIFLISLISLGGGIEILQSFIPERSGTIGDFTVDVIGVFAGALFARASRPLLTKWL